MPETWLSPSSLMIQLVRKLKEKKNATNCIMTLGVPSHVLGTLKKTNIVYVKSQLWTPWEIPSYFICW